MELLKKKSLYADLALILTQAIWGFGFIIVKASLDIIHPVVLLGVEFTLSAAILGAYLFFKRKSLFQNYGKGLVLGFILWIGYMTHVIGLSTISATNAAFITSLSIILVPLAGRFLFKKAIGIQNIVAVLIALIGVWILTGGISNFRIGDVLTLFTALFVALHILFTDKFVNEKTDPLTLNFQQLAVVGFLSLVTMAIFRFPVNVWHTSVIWTIIYVVLLADIFAYVAQTFSQKYTLPVRVAIIFTLEPVFTAFFAWIFRTEALVFSTLVGGALVVLALLISEIPFYNFFRFEKQRI